MEFSHKQIEILNVAEQLFAKEGYDGTSVREISKIAHINVAMISYYFGSKAKLLEALVIHRIGSLGLKLENIVLENISPIKKIDLIIEYYIHLVNTNRHIHQILHQEASNNKREINLDAFIEVKKNNIKLVQSVISEGQKMGIFKKNINVPLLAPIIVGSLVYFNTNKALYGDLFNLKTDEDFNNYVDNELTQHIQQTIKALLIYEN
ncbi:MAG: TetR/AcrR family transcriptional regulator [Flavobacterium sp.]|nr:TetR/AcrR family transcriptional regulator [Flavobacterium sp.]